MHRCAWHFKILKNIYFFKSPGGVIVGDSGLCCCVPDQCVTSIVPVPLLPTAHCLLNQRRSYLLSLVEPSHVGYIRVKQYNDVSLHQYDISGNYHLNLLTELSGEKRTCLPPLDLSLFLFYPADSVLFSERRVMIYAYFVLTEIALFSYFWEIPKVKTHTPS